MKKAKAAAVKKVPAKAAPAKAKAAPLPKQTKAPKASGKGNAAGLR